MPEISSGDTAWVLVSAAMVLLMTPALAFFYGGMVRMKSVLNMMMMSFGALALITVLWVLYGYSFAFGDSVGGMGLLGDPTEFLGLKGLMNPESVSGSIRRWRSWPSRPCSRSSLSRSSAAPSPTAPGSAPGWCSRRSGPRWVYFPVAHWVFAFSSKDGSYTGGWIANKLGAIDFAGGTAVHINAGAAGLALAIVLGKRIGFGRLPSARTTCPS